MSLDLYSFEMHHRCSNLNDWADLFLFWVRSLLTSSLACTWFLRSVDSISVIPRAENISLTVQIFQKNDRKYLVYPERPCPPDISPWWVDWSWHWASLYPPGQAGCSNGRGCSLPVWRSGTVEIEEWGVSPASLLCLLWWMVTPSLPVCDCQLISTWYSVSCCLLFSQFGENTVHCRTAHSLLCWLAI